jgi:hypothetical protein
MHRQAACAMRRAASVVSGQPADTRKGRMWYDLKMDDWVFEIDQSTGEQIAARLVQIGRDLPAAHAVATKARTYAHERMAEMIAAIPWLAMNPITCTMSVFLQRPS